MKIFQHHSNLKHYRSTNPLSQHHFLCHLMTPHNKFFLPTLLLLVQTFDTILTFYAETADYLFHGNLVIPITQLITPNSPSKRSLWAFPMQIYFIATSSNDLTGSTTERCSIKNVDLKNFAKFTRKFLCQSLF